MSAEQNNTAKNRHQQSFEDKSNKVEPQLKQIFCRATNQETAKQNQREQSKRLESIKSARDTTKQTQKQQTKPQKTNITLTKHTKNKHTAKRRAKPREPRSANAVSAAERVLDAAAGI